MRQMTLLLTLALITVFVTGCSLAAAPDEPDYKHLEALVKATEKRTDGTPRDTAVSVMPVVEWILPLMFDFGRPSDYPDLELLVLSADGLHHAIHLPGKYGQLESLCTNELVCRFSFTVPDGGVPYALLVTDLDAAPNWEEIKNRMASWEGVKAAANALYDSIGRYFGGGAGEAATAPPASVDEATPLFRPTREFVAVQMFAGAGGPNDEEFHRLEIVVREELKANGVIGVPRLSFPRQPRNGCRAEVCLGDEEGNGGSFSIAVPPQARED